MPKPHAASELLADPELEDILRDYHAQRAIKRERPPGRKVHAALKRLKKLAGKPFPTNGPHPLAAALWTPPGFSTPESGLLADSSPTGRRIVFLVNAELAELACPEWARPLTQEQQQQMLERVERLQQTSATRVPMDRRERKLKPHTFASLADIRHELLRENGEKRRALKQFAEALGRVKVPQEGPTQPARYRLAIRLALYAADRKLPLPKYVELLDSALGRAGPKRSRNTGSEKLARWAWRVLRMPAEKSLHRTLS